MYFNPNPSFNRSYYSINRDYPRSIIYPRFNTRVRTPSVINLSKILDTTQRGINTINQIVPIYKQVTPIFKQVANFSKSVNSFLFRKQNNIKNPTQEINDTLKKEDYRKVDNSSNPFFK